VSEFRFAEPQWVHALWAVLGLMALLFWLDLRGGSALTKLIGRGLQQRLVERPSVWRRRLRLALLGLSAVCLVLALMRPQWGLRHVATPRVGAEIMIALDVSRSMLAEDVAPNRLERAKAEIADLLGYLDGDQVGLIAFAGRATVLSPLTPDFGFLRLALDGAGPGSVARGGTRLEEPLRKALAGFGPTTDASRAILLITDGEDHGSFPLDAARDAAEAGIVVIAIGFGDEAGSEIHVTDPRTGARTLLRDGEGRPVTSRLDGSLLREIALATGGAYVPAGTGVLDLESIYDQHVARLTRGTLDPRGRTVRDEAYQWFVLLGLVLLVSSVAVAARPAARLAALGLVLLLASAPDASAQPPPAPPDAEANPPAAETGAPTRTETPREVYNRGVDALSAGDLEVAESLLTSARREARGDGELRFRATYDLGWLEMQKSGRIEGEDPRAALEDLRRAADWFREAVQLRPDDEDARANLDVALRRALVLADRLARAGEGGVDAQLEALAERERHLASDIAGLHERVVAAGGPHPPDSLREAFRGYAATQRTILADSDRLASGVDDERRAIEERPEEERSPEDAMRAAQLAGTLHYLHRARERMGGTRSQLRQRQSERAYRRASAALAELKRARDQLREPAAWLDALLRDATELAAGTRVLAASRSDLLGGEGTLPAPAWLTSEGLAETQQSVSERTGEFHLRLRAGIDARASEGSEASAEQRAFLAAVVEAEPHVREAADRFGDATEALRRDDPTAAVPAQLAGIAALADARERFLDVKGLIEVLTADESRIAGVLAAEGDEAEAVRREAVESVRAAQVKNLERGARLEEMLARQREALSEGPAPSPSGAPPDPEASEAQRKRLELASQLLVLALGSMDDVEGALDSGAPRWEPAREGAVAALTHLEALRRLFLTIVEQLRDLGRRQVDLGDATRDALALAADAAVDPAARAAPLVEPQQALADRALELANALDAQARETGGLVGDDPGSAASAEALRAAAELVLGAEGEMRGATERLSAAPPGFEEARTHQDEAVRAIQEALARLEPPSNPEGEKGGEQPQGGDEGQGEGRPEDQEQERAGPPQDPAQLLQGVRDREAQRRRERARQQRSGYDTVEKDW
jgi:Ca-activated chloride channel family protein